MAKTAGQFADEVEAPNADSGERDPMDASEPDSSVSFAELVWAHHKRQHEVVRGVQKGKWEEEYRRRLCQFEVDHGDLFDAYWCRYEASGVALTHKVLPRKPRNFFRGDAIMRLHTATDWRTENAPTIAALLHEWEIVGIRAGEVLRDTSEKIALHRIFAASSRLLAFVDREKQRKIPASTLRDVELAQRQELSAVRDYYERAGENSARIVYFRGMAWGALLLAAVLGAAFLLVWALDWVDPDEPRTQAIFVTVAMGAAGAILSVMTRMAKTDGFNLDFEVGRKSVRFLGGLRPWIGAMFALALYLAMKSEVLELLQGTERTIYFYATIAFLAGFSERWAKVMLDGVTGGSDDGRVPARSTSTKASPTSPGAGLGNLTEGLVGT